MRCCRRCGELHPISSFGNDSQNKNTRDGVTGRHSWCRACRATGNQSYCETHKSKIANNNKEYYLKNVEKFHDYHVANATRIKKRMLDRFLLREYGLSTKDYELIAASQNGKCAICGVKFSTLTKRQHVDHDHFTGVVRGLLCPRCNVSLGCLERGDGWVGDAIRYLIKHNSGAVDIISDAIQPKGELDRLAI